MLAYGNRFKGIAKAVSDSIRYLRSIGKPILIKQLLSEGSYFVVYKVEINETPYALRLFKEQFGKEEVDYMNNKLKKTLEAFQGQQCILYPIYSSLDMKEEANSCWTLSELMTEISFSELRDESFLKAYVSTMLKVARIAHQNKLAFYDWKLVNFMKYNGKVTETNIALVDIDFKSFESGEPIGATHQSTWNKSASPRNEAVIDYWFLFKEILSVLAVSMNDKSMSEASLSNLYYRCIQCKELQRITKNFSIDSAEMINEYVEIIDDFVSSNLYSENYDEIDKQAEEIVHRIVK